MLEQFAMPISITRIGTDPEEATNNLFYRILQAADPTGILTVPDFIKQINETINNPSKFNLFWSVLMAGCILPIAGYYSKSIIVGIKTGKTAIVLTNLDKVLMILQTALETASIYFDFLKPNQLQMLKQSTEFIKQNNNGEYIKEITYLSKQYIK